MRTGYQIVLAVVAALALLMSSAPESASVIPCGTDAECVALNGGDF